ncbi:type IV pilus twitching motility protein PilT [Brevifollis gellanilyticus]|uniref:Twitching motility protein PilT n=1 Tax=Brevifollis gellanilyticus TaxID=748831 RepID=A0A512MHI8_9BACT|nr:PilT/PilU family type 4a pilus ATPase [Brevifollis gellanilyticus]GEP46203.1 twitching motility protein PilT [Brevifollis gellanilyticus]
MRQYDLIEYLAMAMQAGASDLHLSPGAAPTMRLHGKMTPVTEEILDSVDVRELVLGGLKDAQRAKLEQEWELDFAIEVENLGRFRGNACFCMGRIEGNFRYIPDAIPELTQLGHGPTVEKLCHMRDGLILITGVSNSGKTTTLCSMTQQIAAERSCNIVTIEDPIEFVFKHGQSLIRQRQVGFDTHEFARAMKSALRQDVNVITVSELRDLETMRTALTAAETGHLVISTLHTTDVPATITRILDSYPKEQQEYVAAQLSHCLRGIVCQHLIRRADGEGRVMASEVMTINNAVMSCIRDQRIQQLASLIQIGGRDGMHTIDDSLLHLLTYDFITLEDAKAHCRDYSFIKMGYEKLQRERGGQR